MREKKKTKKNRDEASAKDGTDVKKTIKMGGITFTRSRFFYGHSTVLHSDRVIACRGSIFHAGSGTCIIFVGELGNACLMDIGCIIGRSIIPWSGFPVTLTLQLDIYGASDTVKGQRSSLHHLTEPCLLQLPMERDLDHMLHRISCGHTVLIDFLLTQHEGAI